MRPTRTSTLAIVAVVCALAAWLLLHSFYQRLPPLPWTGVPALLVASVAEAWTGRDLKNRIAGKRGLKPAAPLFVSRMVALAKASSLAGAAIAGLAAGFVIYLSGSLSAPVPRQDALTGAITLAAALWAARLNTWGAWFALLVAFFTASVAGKRVAAIVSLVVGYLVTVLPPGHTTGTAALALLAFLIALLAAAELLRASRARAAEVASRRSAEALRRSSEERMAMARDLHDVVAHNISVINVQANTALHLMDRQPERARSALTTINDVSKQALVELRSVLGVLRDIDESAPRAPSPGLARLGDLADSAAAAARASPWMPTEIGRTRPSMRGSASIWMIFASFGQ